MTYVDIAILAITLFLAIIGLWKGFFKSLISLFGFVASIIISLFLLNIVSEALLDIEVIGNFIAGPEGSVYSWVYSMLPEGLKQASISGINSLDVGGIWSIILVPFKDVIANNSSATLTVGQGLALCLSEGVFVAIVMVGLVIVVRLLLCIVTMFLKSLVEKSPGIFNRLFGAVIGGVRGVAWALVIFFVMSFFTGFSFMTKIDEQLDKSTLGKPMYNMVVKIKDKYFISDDGMYDKLLQIAGLKFDINDTDKDTELSEKEQELVDQILLNVCNDNGTLMDYEAYRDTGFYQSIKSIIDYNDSVAESISSKSVTLTPTEIQDFLDALISADGNIRDAYFDLHSALLQYVSRLENDPAAIELESDRQRIEDAIDEIEEAYALFSEKFGAIDIAYYMSESALEVYLKVKEIAAIDISGHALSQYYSKLVIFTQFNANMYDKIEKGTVDSSALATAANMLNQTPSLLSLIESLKNAIDTFDALDDVSQLEIDNASAAVDAALENIASRYLSLHSSFGVLSFN